MAKIKTEECNSIKAELTEYLTKLQEDTKAVKTAIEGFYDIPNDKMDGDDFIKVKAHLKAYSELFESIQSKIDELNVAQGEANDKMEKYVDEYSTYEVPEITDPVNNEDMLDTVRQKEKEYKDDYDMKKESECVRETTSAEYYNGKYIGTVTNHYTSGNEEAKFHHDQVQAAYDLWQKYVKGREYLERLATDDESAYKAFNESLTILLDHINEKNDGIIEMTVKASIKEKIIADPTGFTLEDAKKTGIDSIDYDQGYFDYFKSGAGAGSADSALNDDNNDSIVNGKEGDTGAVTFGRVLSGIYLGKYLLWEAIKQKMKN